MRAGRAPRGADDEIREELEFHLEGRAEEFMVEGAGPEEARRRALAAFGDVDRVESACRRVQGRAGREWWEPVAGVGRQVGLALRGLRRNPAFGIMAVAVLAVGIGANVAVFTVVNSVLLRPLPYAHADRLVRVWPTKNFNIALARDVGELPALEAVSGIGGWTLSFSDEQGAEEVDAAAVSPGYFSLLGVTPELGRTFDAEEGFIGASRVVILSHGFWQRRFGADPDVIGRVLPLEGYGVDRRVVIGVMPEDHRDPWEQVDLWIPLHSRPGITVVTDSSWYVNRVIARLAPGATTDEATAQLRAMATRLRVEAPGALDDEEAATAMVMELHDNVVGGVRPVLWVVLGGVGIVLAIACANVATLVLARGNRREREMGVRAALGAPRGRLFREQLIEHGVVAALGGIAAVPVAAMALRGLSAGASEILPRGDLIALDGMALAFATAVTVMTAVASGAVPAWRSARRAIGDAVRGGERAGLSAGSHRINRALVAFEVAAVMVLVVGAGLVVRSLDRLTSVDPGFSATSARILVTAVPEDAPQEVRAQYYRALSERLASLPGVADVGGIHLLPLRAGNWAFPYLAEGHLPPAGAPLPSANFRIVVPGYFRTMGIPLLRGRAVDWTDGADGTRVTLINETMANELWPGEDPLGKTIQLFGNNPLTVVGVVGDVRQFALNQPAVAEYYVPLTQFRAGRINMVVRPQPGVDVSAAAMREAAFAVDPTVPIAEIASMETVRADAVASTRFFARLLVAFGGVALVLGLAGVFGVTAYITGSRRPEFGVRLALGASPDAIRRFALRDGMLPVVIGVAVGAAVALGTARVLSGLLFEITPVDVPTYLTVGLGLLVAAAVACLQPVIRASRVDPVRVLRAE